MANDPWPTALGLPQISGYGYDDQPNELRTEVEAGPAQTRQLFRSVPTMFQGNWLWTTAQLGLFEAWRKYVAPGGAWFDMHLLTGAGEALHTVRMVGTPTPRMRGRNRWLVSARMEVEEKQVMNAEDMVIAMYGEADLTLWAEALSDAVQAFDVDY